MTPASGDTISHRGTTEEDIITGIKLVDEPSLFSTFVPTAHFARQVGNAPWSVGLNIVLADPKVAPAAMRDVWSFFGSNFSASPPSNGSFTPTEVVGLAESNCKQLNSDKPTYRFY